MITLSWAGGRPGRVLAARLSEVPDTMVLLLEAGPKGLSLLYSYAGWIFNKMTTRSAHLGFQDAPQRHAMNREIPYVQARALGGGGSINEEEFPRGCPDALRRLG